MAGVQVHPEVAAALAAGGPVVALESTLVSHGLPRPDNLKLAREAEQVIRDHGAVPATVGIADGQACVGLTDDQLSALATRDDVAKASLRDVPIVAARHGYAGTTVAATAALAARVGVQVFATGGIGGVHRRARESFDESADLAALARTPITVVCAGVKSILDVGATLERLESLGVAILGYRTDTFPGFYLTDSGWPLDWRVNEPAQVAEVMREREAMQIRAALVVANPLPPDQQLDPDLHDRVLAEALDAAEAAGVHGKDVTPFLLDRFHRGTGGASLAANVAMILRNAELAARIARAASPGQVRS